MKRISGFFVYLLFLMLSGQLAFGSTHYPCGGEGVGGAVVPPSHLPGTETTKDSAFHYQAKLIYYTADQICDDDGEKSLDADLDIIVNVHRFVWTKMINARSDWGLHLLVPIQSTDLRFSVPGGPTVADDDQFGLGDPYLEALYGIHEKKYDIVLAAGVALPLGDYDSSEPASIGLGYTTFIFTGGINYKFGSNNLWSASALSRYLINTEQDETNITPGNELLVEWGLGNTIPVSPTFLVTPGVFGHGYWQVTENDGNGASDEKVSAYSLGVECNFFALKKALQINIRGSQEFNVKNDAEGYRVEIKLTKSWF